MLDVDIDVDVRCWRGHRRRYICRC